MVTKSVDNNIDQVSVIEAEDLTSIDSDNLNQGVRKSKKKLQVILIILGSFLVIFVSLVFYFVERPPRAVIISDEVSELKNIVKILQVELKEQKLENMALNSKILNIGKEFEHTDTALSENKTFNKEMFASLTVDSGQDNPVATVCKKMEETFSHREMCFLLSKDLLQTAYNDSMNRLKESK